MNKNKIKVALWGFGTVGSGVIDILKNNYDLIKNKAGIDIEIKYIIEKDTARFKNYPLGKIQVKKDIEIAIKDKEIDIIIELIGGLKIAKDGIMAAIKNKKHVVTANKAVLSKYWEEIFNECIKNEVLLYFEASVGGGIPILQAINEGLAANRIKTIIGILNGTTNYILTKMSKEDFDFKTALTSAKVNGFAERNPYLDISGKDTTHKLSILSSLAFGKWIKTENIYREGISRISNLDIKYGKEKFGYVLKLLAFANNKKDGLDAFVVPAFLSEAHPLSNVDNEYNAILVKGDLTADTMYYGKGAGKLPAASAVVSDLIFISRQVKYSIAGQIPYVTMHTKDNINIRSMDEIHTKYYLRFSTLDKPGVLATIAGILSENQVSIESCIQKGKQKSGVPIIFITHNAQEKNVKNAIKIIDKLSIIKTKTILIRIFENI